MAEVKNSDVMVKVKLVGPDISGICHRANEENSDPNQPGRANELHLSEPDREGVIRHLLKNLLDGKVQPKFEFKGLLGFKSLDSLKKACEKIPDKPAVNTELTFDLVYKNKQPKPNQKTQADHQKNQNDLSWVPIVTLPLFLAGPEGAIAYFAINAAAGCGEDDNLHQIETRHIPNNYGVTDDDGTDEVVTIDDNPTADDDMTADDDISTDDDTTDDDAAETCETSCIDEETLELCHEDGSPATIPCPDGTTCTDGGCVTVETETEDDDSEETCVPSCIDENTLGLCPDGGEMVSAPCPDGTTCLDTGCVTTAIADDDTGDDDVVADDDTSDYPVGEDGCMPQCLDDYTLQSCLPGGTTYISACDEGATCVDNACRSTDPLNCPSGTSEMACWVTDVFDLGEDFSHNCATYGSASCRDSGYSGVSGSACGEDAGMRIYLFGEYLMINTWFAFDMGILPPPYATRYRLDMRVKDYYEYPRTSCDTAGVTTYFGAEQGVDYGVSSPGFTPCLLRPVGYFSTAGITSNSVRINVDGNGHDFCSSVGFGSYLVFTMARIWSCACTADE